METVPHVGRFIFCGPVKIQPAHTVGVVSAEQPIAGTIGEITTKFRFVVGNAGNRRGVLLDVVPGYRLGLFEQRGDIGGAVVGERCAGLPVAGDQAGLNVIVDAADRFAEASMGDEQGIALSALVIRPELCPRPIGQDDFDGLVQPLDHQRLVRVAPNGHVLLIPPQVGTAVLQEEDDGLGVRWRRHLQSDDLNPLFLRHLFKGFRVIPDALELHFLLLEVVGSCSAVDKLFRHTPVSYRFPTLYGLGKFGVRLLPFVNGIHVDAEVFSQVEVNGAYTAKLLSLTIKLRLIKRLASSFCDNRL
nr:hypothetical protein [Mesorhizobium sp.]